MGILACCTSVVFGILTLIKIKNKTISPMILFFLIWSFVLFLSIFNFYNIIKPSNEAYAYIIIMLTFFFLGSIVGLFIDKKNKKVNEKNKKTNKVILLINKGLNKIHNINFINIIYVFSFFIILFNLIDIFIMIKYVSLGEPLWVIRNWQLSPYGSNNPLFERRSFFEEILRSIILTPFATIIPPITAFEFFNSNNKKKNVKLLIISLLVLITSSIAGGGGRLGFVYYFGSFLLAFLIKYKVDGKNKFNVKKYAKYIVVMLVLGISVVVLCTILRTGFGKFFKQIYTYFALPPTLLTIWLDKIKDVPHTYGFLTCYGIFGYFFRILDTLGINCLVPNVYYNAYQSIINAEKFTEVGFGSANAFVTPIYYFYIDGGIPFICIASFIFGMVVYKIHNWFEKNINLNRFIVYTLITYAVFLTFIRIQTVIPQFFISFVYAFLFFDKNETYNKEVKKKDEVLKPGSELISVVVPIYNVEKYLRKCIDSILNQTYKNIEIILIDDGSPDKAGEICDEYELKDKRVKVIHQKNGGLSNARNTGIKNAKGKYITFVDSDDFLDLDYVECLYGTLEKYNADISICSHRVVYDKKIIDKSSGNIFCEKPIEILKRILYDNDVDLSSWGKLYKTSLFENVCFPDGRIYEDSATTYKLIDLCQNIAVNSKSKYNYVIRKNSISQNTFNEKKMELIISTKEMTDYVSYKYSDLKKACDRRLMYAYLSTLSQLTKSKERNINIEKQLMSYIKENRRNVLKDRNIPFRDRIGLYSTFLGFKFYKIIWNLYYKISGRN